MKQTLVQSKSEWCNKTQYCINNYSIKRKILEFWKTMEQILENNAILRVVTIYANYARHSGQNSETYDVLHALLSLVVAKLSDLKNSPVNWPTLYRPKPFIERHIT